MAKIILTSDGIDSAEIENEFKKHINSRTKIAIITSAKEGQRKKDAEEKNEKLFKELFDNKNVTFIDFEFDSADKLFNYDFIYILGGNPFKLMHLINISNSKLIFEKISNSNKVIAGVSAGSMVLGTNMGICDYLSPEMNIVELYDFTGLNLTDINICPHYNNFPSKYENCDSKVESFCKDYKTKITKFTTAKL